MQKCASLKNVNKEKVVLYDKDCSHLEKGSTLPQKRRIKTFGNILEHYTITIRPKLQKSSSLSDLASNKSDFTVDLVRQTSKLLTKNKIRETIFGCSGDAVAKYYKQELTDTTYLTWNFKGKKPRRKSNNMNDCTRYGCKFTPCQNEGEPEENTSCTDNTSISSSEQINKQKGASFPFKSTPSGNLKVQSNQVVFQSSTVGVLLADPTQAKVKVKFGGPTEEQDDDGETNNDDNSELGHLNFFPQEALAEEVQSKEPLYNERCKFVPPSRRDEKGKDLSSLGYNSAEPIDWMRIQLPKKQDLLQEFYKRIHNYVNTDTIVHIGDEEYHCHRIVLQIYSGFFEQYHAPEIELPLENVTPESFQTIYEWMIFNGPDNNKGLKRENILDVFVAAQFLSIKDLEEQCWTLIVDENVFTEDSAFVLFREASRKGLIPVMDLMIPRVSKFFLPLVASKDFLDLLPEEVMAFMKSNNICVTSEIEVLMAGVRWLYGDWSQRQHLTVDIMRCVRFGLISPWQLVDIKRNPDNAEILEIVSQPEVQQMVDDGLAYVIIKYWYGNNSKIYYHWIDVLGLTEPAERNWIGEEKNHVTYKDFLKYLEQFMVPKDQMYQQMSIMQSTKRSEDAPGGCLRGLESSKLDMRRPKMDFPLPATLKGLAGDKDKDFPTMSEFIESRKKREDGGQSSSPASSPGEMGPSFMLARRRTNLETEVPQPTDSPRTRTPGRRSDQCKLSAATAAVAAAAAAPAQRPVFRSNVQQVQMCTVTHELPPNVAKMRSIDMYNEPEKESSEDRNTASSDTDKDIPKKDERRHSVAASYLAAATAALSSNRRPYRTTPQGSPDRTAQSRVEAAPMPGTANPQPQPQPQQQPQQNSSDQNSCSAHISLFNHSKESLARMNMNKLSTSILGPPNKNYVQEGSLFNWDRETVLVFGGIDPHNTYGVAKNTGQDVYRFDPVGNVWEIVGELPEPRHHHAVAFLKGRVYLVGGADPRDDDVHGKSVVVSTVWSFEPVTRSWHSEAGLSTPRKNFGLVVHRMALYAIGGQDKKGRVLRSVEKFDYKSSSWAEVRSMNIARMAIASVKYREYIWVAGGMTGDKKNPVCKTVECFNSKTNEWTQIHSLRFPRCFATMFTMNDKLYILGGAGKTVEKDKTASSVGAIDSWDWASRKWRLETEMSIPRHGHALAYLGTQLIIIGGVTTIYMRALNNVESYCCERGAWIRGVAALPSPLSGHGAVTLPPASLM